MKRPIPEVLRAAGATVFERGWLSANNILLRGNGPTALIDSGYASHSDQTLALVTCELGDQPLDLLLNTHLHSDHCGGNAALQQRYPKMQTCIPPGQADAVANWDEEVLTYRPTGQFCPRFSFDSVLTPGQSISLGGHHWEIHGAKGHDPHSIVLFHPEHKLLISADALWQNGFGVVFPELEGVDAFNEVGQTLELIETLAPATVIPGHGQVFQDVSDALKRAHTRLEQFQRAPDKHRRHAMKVLLKFRLLEWKQISRTDMLTWVIQTPYLAVNIRTSQATTEQWLDDILGELAKAGALELRGEMIKDR